MADTPSGETKAQKGAAEAATWADERYHPAGGLRRQIVKVFPDHWSFLLGEMALYSFIILILSGVFLTFFFDPSLTEVTYNGVYQNLRGVEMSKAFESTLNISFDVRAGLFVRQIHHWAALLFLASMVVHLCRNFFTGAFRKPREVNWVIGASLLLLGIVEGFVGYSLPDDLLSGTGLRIMSAIILAVPVVGTWIQFLVFGGEFPGEIINDRFYIAHVLLIPGILLALIAAHLALVWYQKHTQFPAAGRTERNVVGVRIMPVFAAHGLGWFAMVFGMLALMSGLFQINAVWNYGPYDPAMVSAGSQPDWYMGFTDGIIRLWPAWEMYIGNYTIPQPFVPAMLLGVMFALLFGWPFIERKLTKDNVTHNLLQRPRDAPTRTSLGSMAIAFYVILTIASGDDLIALKFDISLNAITWFLRMAMLVVPPIVFLISYRFCLGLQRSDLQVLEHGVETGILKRDNFGDFVEMHQPLGGMDAHDHPVPLDYQGATVPKKMNKLGFAGKPAPGSLFIPDPPEQVDALNETEHTAERAERRALSGLPDAGKPSDERN